MPRKTATAQPWAQPDPRGEALAAIPRPLAETPHISAQSAEPSAAKEVASATPAPGGPRIFKPIGYVEKAGGRVEAVVSQDDQVLIVHMGDLIADKYRVLKISPDSVEAVDETLAYANVSKPAGSDSEELSASGKPRPSPQPKAIAANPPSALPTIARKGEPPAPQGLAPSAERLGFVEKSNGQVETVVADGENVRLIPTTPAVAVARNTPANTFADKALVVQASAGPMAGPVISLADEKPSGTTPTTDALPVLMKPIGFVEKAGGEIAAILSCNDEVYVVHPGDYFAGRFRALEVTAETVKAAEIPFNQGLMPPLFQSTSGSDFLSLEIPGSQPPFNAPRDSLPTLGHHSAASSSKVFPVLGSVETADGRLEDILENNGDVYLVKPGDVLADQYLVTSIGPALVLAVRVTAGQDGGDRIFTKTEAGKNSLWPSLDGFLQLPHAGVATAGPHPATGVIGNSSVTNPGLNALGR
jgi:hypothetical protein